MTTLPRLAPRSSARRHLTAAPLLLAALAFAPAADPGRDILFTASPNGRNDQIWRMNRDGSAPRAMTPAVDGIQERFAAWSPDGTTIAFLSNRHAPGRARPAIFLMTADGSSAWKVGPDSIPYQGGPDFSPDGTRIVFSGGKMGGAPLSTDLYVMDVRGADVRRLTQLDAFIACPRWSPDGSRLAFSSGPDGQLPNLREVLANPSFPREIVVLEVARGELTRMPQGGPHATYPRWSPDGRHLVFQAHIPPGGAFVPGFMPIPGASEVYVMDADGREVRRLTYNTRMDGEPSW